MLAEKTEVFEVIVLSFPESDLRRRFYLPKEVAKKDTERLVVDDASDDTDATEETSAEDQAPAVRTKERLDLLAQAILRIPEVRAVQRDTDNGMRRGRRYLSVGVYKSQSWPHVLALISALINDYYDIGVEYNLETAPRIL